MHRLFPLLLLAACDNSPHLVLNLTEPLGPDEVRAGVVTSPDALFGGISAEGRVGDIKIYNDRVRFIIQGTRPGSYYISQGGTVIDADAVRPDGEPGRDVVDEWGGMYGLGRLMQPEHVAVVDSGVGSGRAVVVAAGPESPMTLITGALESPDLVPDGGLYITTEFILEPGSSFLEVRSTITAIEDPATISPADIVMGAPEVAAKWAPPWGMSYESGSAPWVAYVGRRSEVAVMLAPVAGETFRQSPLDAISSLADLLAGSGDSLEIPAGESVTYTRYYGVGPDLETLTGALLDLHGEPSDTASGVVDAPDGPVAGARVGIRVDGDAWTLALTDGAGAWHARVPAGAEVEALAIGRGTRRYLDLPAGAAAFSPYEATAVATKTLAWLEDGAPGSAFAEGRGVGSDQAPTTLLQPATLVLTSADGEPFEARVVRLDAVDAVDDRFVPGDPGDGAWALAWARQGEVTVPLEPGQYRVDVHRGIRFDRASFEITLAGGDVEEREVDLPQAYVHPGWLLGDPHSHASPSGDAAIPMEDRLAVAAGVGIQLHFGTDHDHIADYHPLLGPLGLDGVLGTVISDEMSPPLRGHLNLYPIEEVRTEPNNGAYSWWDAFVPDTATQMEQIRAQHPDAVVQVNHPMSSGLASSADWRAGEIREPDRWTTDFQAAEVMNAGSTEGLAFYLDMIDRGQLVTPVGVSDSHSHTGGDVGFSATFIGVGTDDPGAVTPDVLREAMLARRTVVTRGPLLDLSIDPGSLVTGSATLEVNARGPGWMALDRLRLLRDGVEVDVVAGTSASFDLSPDADASYVVIAEGDTPMGVGSGRTPWAMSSAILVDVEGDGWDPPLPALILGP